MKVEKTFITKEVVKTEKVEQFVLTLSREEATIVLMLVGSVSGCNSTRDKCSELFECFHKLGINQDNSLFSGSVYVK